MGDIRGSATPEDLKWEKQFYEESNSTECSGGCGKCGLINYENDQFYCGGSPSCCP